MDVKIVLQFEDRTELYILKTNEPLSINIRNICKYFNLANDKEYGLKLLETNDGTIINHYVYEENFDTLSNGFKLLLTDSLEKKVRVIIESIKRNTSKEYHIKDLLESSEDLAFIKELIKQEKHNDILNIMAEDNVESQEMFTYSKVLLEILQKKMIVNLSGKLLIKITKIIKEGLPEKTLTAALAMASQILRMKSSVYNEAKEQLLQNLSIDNLYTCFAIKCSNLNINNLQLNAIVLINTMARLLKGQLQLQFLCKMNALDNKGLIYTHCIENKKIEKDMAKALNVYQTLAMSVLKEKLAYVKREQTTMDDANSVRYSLISMSESESPIREIGDMLNNEREYNSNNARMSLASITSIESDATYLSTPLEYVSNRISSLTNECIDHFERNHNRNFQQAVADKTVGVEFLYVAERITMCLTKIFRIGNPPTVSEFFYPIFFKKSICAFYFHELFARAFWLYLRLKREMNVKKKEDYDIVFKIFEYQLATILRQRPDDYKQLMDYMKKSSYNTIAIKIQKEMELEFAYVLKNNPGINYIKPKITKDNQNLIFEQRMNVLKLGEYFPKHGYKNMKIFVKLNQSLNVFTWGNWNQINKKLENSTIFNVKDIEYLIVGKACPHVKNNTVNKSDEHLAFSLQLRDDTLINCVAKNSCTAHYWTDGISLLMGLKDRSTTYEKDLETLNEMDLHLNLIELQNFRIPTKPPYIPPEPLTLPPNCTQ